jgi:ABC-type uncharacterized transport system auxiliary subunit
MQRLFLIVCFLLITACSSQAPLPTDHYYRLPELTDISSDEERVRSISVISFQADGLHKERAILYSENNIELRQYHYHHWVDSPHRLLQQRLAERLRMSNIASVILTTFEGNSDLIIKGQLKKFERTKNDATDDVNISLYIRVDENQGNLPVLFREYNKTVAVQNSSMVSVINAFNTAINSIYDEFYTDLKQTLSQ